MKSYGWRKLKLPGPTSQGRGYQRQEADLKLSDDEISRILKQSVETDETISDTDEIDITAPLLSGKAEK